MTTPRQALIKKIQIAKRAIAMHDDDYRTMLQRLTGKTSSTVLDVAELESVVKELRALGWQEDPKYRNQSLPSHVRLIHGLWREAGQVGAIGDTSKEALRAFVKRQTGVSDARFLRNFKDATPVIEALKKMVKRSRDKLQEVHDGYGS